MTKNLKLTISVSTNNLLTFEGKDVKLSEKAEHDILALVAVEEKLKEMRSLFEDAILAEMEKTNTMHVERGNLTLRRKLTGQKFAFDPASKVDAKYVKTISYPSVNSEVVGAYLTLKGKLPKGIIEKGRQVKLDIKIDE